MSTIRKQSLSTHIASSFSTIFSNAGIFVPIALLLGTLDVFLFRGALSLNDIDPSTNILKAMQTLDPITGQPQMAQSDLIKLTFSFLGLAIGIKSIIGPIIAIITAMYARATAMEQNVGFGKILNFALKRYKHVFVPYLLAMLSIQFGMLIVIPGIMFMMQYAFVDSVAAFEKEPHVLTRSKRLTKARRKSLIILIIPFVLIGQGMQFVDFIFSSSIPKLIGFHSLYEGLFLVISACFYMLYHERVALIEQRKQRRAAKAAEPTDTDGSTDNNNTEQDNNNSDSQE